MKKVTIWKDKGGNLHIFLGYNKDLFLGKYMACDRKRNQADLFFQTQDDVEAIESTLTEDKLNELNNGYQINHKIDSLYFPAHIFGN